MKLHNKTRINDEALYKVLKLAGESINAKVDMSRTDINVKKTYMFGEANGRVVGQVGTMTVNIKFDHIHSLESAWGFYLVAAHEWKHISDFQNGKRGMFTYDDEPFEQRAEVAMQKAREVASSSQEIQNAIKGLAIEIEKAWEEKYLRR